MSGTLLAPTPKLKIRLKGADRSLRHTLAIDLPRTGFFIIRDRNNERRNMSRFLVAQTNYYLYDSSRPSKWACKHEAISTAKRQRRRPKSKGLSVIPWEFVVIHRDLASRGSQT